MDIQKEIALNVSIKLSEKICHKIATQTMRKMQKIDSKLAEIESLKNVWDDICYQHQVKMSNDWRHYSWQIIITVRSLVQGLEDYELNAVLLQHPNAERYVMETIRDTFVPISNYQAIDFSKHEFYVSVYIIEKYIYEKAKTWSNDSLRNAVYVPYNSNE